MADIKIYGRLAHASGDRLANASEIRDDAMANATGISTPTQAQVNNFFSLGLRYMGTLDVTSSSALSTIKNKCNKSGMTRLWVCSKGTQVSGGYAVCASDLATALHSGDSRGVAVNLGDLLIARNDGGTVTVKCIPLNDAKKPADAGGVGTYGLMVPNDKEKLDQCVADIDQTCFRSYSGEYNMNYCGWYGYWMYGTLGRPGGSSDGEHYVLRVANGGTETDDDGDTWIVLEQTAYSCMDAGRVFRRIVKTKDRNAMDTDGNTTWGDWTQIGGADIVVDDTFSSKSTNPVQNKVVKEALEDKQEKLTAGDGIEINEDNVISSSGGIYTPLAENAEATVSVAVGGIAKGTKASDLAGKTISAMFDEMLYPTIYPTFTDPSVTITPTATKTVEVGQVFPYTEDDFSVSYSRGGIYLDGVKQGNRAGEETGRTWNIDGGSEWPSTVGYGTAEIYVTVDFAEGDRPKDSKGNDYGEPLEADSVDSNVVKVMGGYVIIAGSYNATTLTTDTIENVRNDGAVSSPVNGSSMPSVSLGVTLSAESYTWLCVPETITNFDVSKLKDGYGFGYDMDSSYDTVEYNGINYHCYHSAAKQVAGAQTIVYEK